MAVADTGSGIDAEHLPHIFERHYAVAATAPGAAKEATGLGLAIVRKILELHDSRLTIVSERESGTEVRFDLPAAA